MSDGSISFDSVNVVSNARGHNEMGRLDRVRRIGPQIIIRGGRLLRLESSQPAASTAAARSSTLSGQANRFEVQPKRMSIFDQVPVSLG